MTVGFTPGVAAATWNKETASPRDAYYAVREPRTGGEARGPLLARGSEAQAAAERYEPHPSVRNLERLLSKVKSPAPRRPDGRRLWEVKGLMPKLRLLRAAGFTADSSQPAIWIERKRRQAFSENVVSDHDISWLNDRQAETVPEPEFWFTSEICPTIRSRIAKRSCHD